MWNRRPHHPVSSNSFKHQYQFEWLIRVCGGVRPPSPPRHDTTASEEPTPTRVQPLWQAKTKDANFHYNKWGLHLATTHHTGLARAWNYLSYLFIINFLSPHVFKQAFAYFFSFPFRLLGGFCPFRDHIHEALFFCEPLIFYEHI